MISENLKHPNLEGAEFNLLNDLVNDNDFVKDLAIY